MQSLQNIFLKIIGSIYSSTGGAVDASITSTTANVMSSVVAEHIKSQQESLLLEIDEQFIDTATQDENIIRLANNLGLSQKAATQASGAIDIQGTVGTIIPVGTQFLNSQNIVYQSLTDSTIASSTISVSSIVRVNNIVTVTTPTAHNLASNMLVTISGATPSDLNGIDLMITVTGLNAFTYMATGTNTSGTGTIIVTAVFAQVSLQSLTGSSTANLDSGVPVTLFSVLNNVNNMGYVQYTEITGGSDVETIESLQYRAILAQQVFSADVIGDAFSVSKLQILLTQYTIATRAWVYQADNSSEAGFVTTVSVNDNQSPITLNSTQLASQLAFLVSICPAYLPPISSITTLTANLVPIAVTVTGLTNNTTSMQQSIKQELINYFQTNAVIVRALDPNVITQTSITSVVFTTLDSTTNTRPLFTSVSISGEGSLVNDNDLPVLGTLTINGVVI